MQDTNHIYMSLERRIQRERKARRQAEDVAMASLERISIQNEQLAQHAEQLEEALEASRQGEGIRKEFVNVAAHVLRTPLTSIIIRLHQLKYSFEPKYRAELEKLQTPINHLSEIINDLVLLGQLESGNTYVKPEVVDLEQWATMHPKLRLLPPDGVDTQAVADPDVLDKIIEIIYRAEGRPNQLEVRVRRRSQTIEMTIGGAASKPSTEELELLGLTSHLANGLAKAMKGQVHASAQEAGLSTWSVRVPSASLGPAT